MFEKIQRISQRVDEINAELTELMEEMAAINRTMQAEEVAESIEFTLANGYAITTANN